MRVERVVHELSIVLRRKGKDSLSKIAEQKVLARILGSQQLLLRCNTLFLLQSVLAAPKTTSATITKGKVQVFIITLRQLSLKN